MSKTKTDTEHYRNKIITIVCLTNIPAVLFLLTMYSQAVGWIAGTIGSSINFYWLSYNVNRSMQRKTNSSELSSYKFFYLRYLFLIVYSVIIVVALKPDILVYGLGLVSIQLAIYGYHFYETFKRKDEKQN